MCRSRANTLRANKNDFFAFISVDHEIKHFFSWMNRTSVFFRMRAFVRIQWTIQFRECECSRRQPQQKNVRLDNKHEAKVKIAFELPPNGVRVIKKNDGKWRRKRINDLTDNV